MMRAVIYRLVQNPKTGKVRWRPIVVQAANRAELEGIVAGLVAPHPRRERYDA